MTICNKIQTLGETMETNLNARGVSCTFGTGTNESTILEMVEMVNSTNFKGSSDVNLKIGANRPYLMTGETTDVIVKLENGLCEPLKNKNVIVGKSVFRDGGVTGNKNTNYTTGSALTISTTTYGTSVSSTSSNSTTGRYKGNTAITGDFELIADVKGNQAYSSTVGLFFGVYSNDYTIFRIKSTDWVKVKITRENSVFSVQTSTDNGTTWTDATFEQNNSTSNSVYPVLYVYHNSGSSKGLSYKNLVINNTLTGVTDEKGEFALYDVSVTDNTIFTANYETVNSNEVTIYHCIYRDYAISNNKSNYYINGSGGTTLNWSNGYYVLGLGASSNYVDLKSITDNVKGKTVNFRVDVVLNGASVRLRVFNGSTVLANSPYTTSDGTVKIENVAIPSDATSIMFRLERRYLTDGDSIKFKNFVIY